MISEVDMAYIAGLFDGEGLYILNVVSRRKRNTKVRVIDTQTLCVSVWRLP